MRTGRVRAAAVLVAVLLPACGIVKVKKPPEPAPRGPLKAMKFEGGNEGDQPAGWTVRTHAVEGTVEGERAKFKMEYTESEKRSGKMSALLRPKGKQKIPHYIHSDARFCGDSPFPGSPTRVSAFIKGDRNGIVRFSASEDFTGFNNSFSVLARRGGDWNRHEVVSVPPPGQPSGLDLCVFVSVEGSNRAWIDDVTFTKLDLAGLGAEKAQPVPLENLDMEVSQGGKLANWRLKERSGSEPSEGFELLADSRTKRSGRASLRLTADIARSGSPGGAAEYCFDANLGAGKSLRIGGWIKSDVGERATGVFGVRAFAFTADESQALTREQLLERGDAYSSNVFLRGAADWTRHEVIAFVPKSTVELCIEVRLDQVGSIWADDVTVEVIDL